MVAIAAPAARPARHRLHPRVLGTTIGLSGATTFVLVNRDGLPEPVSGLALAAWVLLLGAALWALLLHPRPMPAATGLHPHAGRIYLASVAGMLLAIQGGVALFRVLDVTYLQPALVVAAVGLHFVPFARAFGAGVFARLGWTLTAVGVVGVAAGALTGPVAVAAAATGAGLVMLTFLTVDTLRVRA